MKGTLKTPEVILNPDGNILFKGRATPDNPIVFYRPIKEWLEAYASNPPPTTDVAIHMEYFNTRSSVFLLELFRLVEEIHLKQETKAHIKWCYEEDDHDLKEAGEHFAEIVAVPFEFEPHGFSKNG